MDPDALAILEECAASLRPVPRGEFVCLRFLFAGDGKVAPGDLSLIQPVLCPNQLPYQLCAACPIVEGVSRSEYSKCTHCRIYYPDEEGCLLFVAAPHMLNLLRLSMHERQQPQHRHRRPLAKRKRRPAIANGNDDDEDYEAPQRQRRKLDVIDEAEDVNYYVQ